MKGYKAFENGLTTTHGFTYELGEKYYQEGEIKWQKNGFHFCENPEDSLRYIDAFNNDYTIAEVEGSGEVLVRADEYEEFFNLYVASEITIKRIVPREEVFADVISSSQDRTKRLIVLSKLNEDEKEIIRELYPELSGTINYYQNDSYALTRKFN